MGRGARADRSDKAERGGGAARVAARRRPAGRGRDAARGAPGRSRGRSGASEGGWLWRIARMFKLLVLVVSFLAMGFFGVLVIDVGASLVGQMRFGDTTVAGLWHKVMDRFLDNDVPRAPEGAAASAPAKRTAAPRSLRPTSPSAAPTSGAARSSTEVAERAPAPASRPEEDARHVGAQPRPDPQVENARRRLDELLGRL